jgi:ammonium transporter Rh
MEIILNASLAGGVACGANADLIASPFGALILGFITGIVSSFGFAYLSKILQGTIGLHDTCGVHNLHGMPGIIGGVASVFIALNGQDTFGPSYNYEYPAGRTPGQNAGY